MKKSSGSVKALLIFGIFWTLFVGAIDSFIAFNVYRQLRARGFPTTPGTVTGSKITSRSDSDGTTYHARIEFAYQVDGTSYNGERYRYGATGTSSRSMQQKVVRRYPVRANVPVHYNPENAGDAVLETGVNEMDMFLVLFLTPFNLVMLWLCGLAGGMIIRRIRRPPAGGVPILRRWPNIVVRLPRFSPLSAAGVTALVLSFVSIFIVAFLMDMNASMNALGITWGIILGCATGVYFWRTFVIGSGAKDLVIDGEGRGMSLPQTFGRKLDVVVPFDSIQELRVERVVHRGSRGGTSYTYAPTLDWTSPEGDSRSEKLADWYDESRAKEFIAWLREHTGRSEK